jgi:hypothetical protein
MGRIESVRAQIAKQRAFFLVVEIGFACERPDSRELARCSRRCPRAAVPARDAALLLGPCADVAAACIRGSDTQRA